MDGGATLTHTLEEMAGRRRKWSLEDLVDFEARLLRSGEGDSAQERRRYREEVRQLGRRTGSEAERRRMGLRTWLEAGRSEDSDGPGSRVAGALRLTGFGVGLVVLLAGTGVMRGLLQPTDLFVRGYNVWLFLAVA